MDNNLNSEMINDFGYNLIENAYNRYTLCGGLIKVVSGSTVVPITKNIGYALLFSHEQLIEWFGSDYTSNRLNIVTYNGDDATQLTHFYAPKIWSDSSVYQYFYPIDKEGNLRVNYRLVYIYPRNIYPPEYSGD